jgi:hypothetical protein
MTSSARASTWSRRSWPTRSSREDPFGSESWPYLSQAWWISLFPGAAVILSVLALNLVGDGLRDFLDPRLRYSA